MNSNGLIEILTNLRSTGFRDVAGTRIAADVPVSARLINDIVAASLPPGAPVREVSINPEAGDRFSVRITPRAGLLPQLTLRLEIERQPDFPSAPVLVMRMNTMGGLFGFVSGAIAKMLPPGVRLEGERILVDLATMAAQQGLAEMVPYIRRLEVHSEDGRVIVHIEATA